MFAAPSFRRAEEVMFEQEDTPRGLYTEFFTRALARIGGAATFAELHHEVSSLLASEGFVANLPDAQGDLDSVIQDGRPGGLRLSVYRQNGTWMVNAGQVHAVAPGYELRIYRPGRRGVADAEVGTATVKTLGFVASEIEPDTPWKWSLGPGERLPANLSRVQVQASKLRLQLIDSEYRRLEIEHAPESVRRILLRGLADDEEFGPADVAEFTTEGGDWTVQIGASGEFQWHAAGAEGAILRHGDADELETAVFDAYRSTNLTRMAARWPQVDLPRGLRVELQREVPPDRSDVWEIVDRERLTPGDLIRVKVTNRSFFAWHVQVFYLSSDFSIAEMFPAEGGSAQVDPVDGEAVGDFFRIEDTSLGFEHVLIVVLPPGVASLSARINPHQDALRGGESETGLGQALSDLFGRRPSGTTFVPRGTKPQSNEGLQLRSYAVSWGERVLGPSESKLAGLIRGQLSAVTRADGLGLEGKPALFPDPWRAGDEWGWFADVSIAILVLEGENARSMFVDLDPVAGSHSLDPTSLIRSSRSGRSPTTFDFAVFSGANQRAAYYDRDGDGEFDHVDVDANGDLIADTRMQRADGQWIITSDIREPWFALDRVGFWTPPTEAREQEANRIRSLRIAQAQTLQQCFAD